MRVWYTVSWCIWLLVIFLWLLSRPVLVAPCISKELLGQLCSHGLKGTKMNTKTKSASQWNLSGSVARWTVKGAVMHAIHSGVFSGTKQKSQKLRVELTAKKNTPGKLQPTKMTYQDIFVPSFQRDQRKGVTNGHQEPDPWTPPIQSNPKRPSHIP